MKRDQVFAVSLRAQFQTNKTVGKGWVSLWLAANQTTRRSSAFYKDAWLPPVAIAAWPFEGFYLKKEQIPK